MELLINLYEIHSMSGQENAMRNFIKKFVKENVPGAVVRQHNHNLYITKGEADTYPCVVAHLDQVQKKHSPDFRVYEQDGILFGFSAKNKRQEGLGADDKNGIWVALKSLMRYDAIKVALFHSEEVGTVGSGEADMTFFKDVRFVLEADRRNGGDLITDIWGAICSDEFIEDISEFADKHGYKETSGMLTDVETLSDNGLGVSAINMSCGYYNPHTDEEVTDYNELLNCLAFVWDIIDNCTKVYKFERSKKMYSKWDDYGYGGYNWKGWYSKKEDKDTALVDERTTRDTYYDDIVLIDIKQYADPCEGLFEYCCDNMNYGSDELWWYIQEDCEACGLTRQDFEAQYDAAFEYMCEMDEDEMEIREYNKRFF